MVGVGGWGEGRVGGVGEGVFIGLWHGEAPPACSNPLPFKYHWVKIRTLIKTSSKIHSA